jgi:hypothetical protein
MPLSFGLSHGNIWSRGAPVDLATSPVMLRELQLSSPFR